VSDAQGEIRHTAHDVPNLAQMASVPVPRDLEVIRRRASFAQDLLCCPMEFLLTREVSFSCLWSPCLHVILYRKPTYIPPTRPYELADLAQDLLYFARYMLKPGGRLVFFLPTVTDEYQDVDVPQAEGMELIANSLQDFGKWGRRVSSIL